MENNQKQYKIFNLIALIMLGIALLMSVCFFNVSQPQHTAMVVDSYKSLADFSTYYGYSAENRASNVELATKKLNNIIVLPNQNFSFNKIVGKRSLENGYKTAPEIYKGKYVDGVGGGVCQVSSTLYNAWLLSGLDVKEYYPHSLPARYVPLSRDATVSEFRDLVLLNTSLYPIIIKSYYNGKDIKISINGKTSQVNYDKIEIVSETTEEVLPKEVEEIIFSDEIKDDLVYEGKIGYKSNSRIDYYQNNQIVKTKLLRKDNYLAQDKIIIKHILKPALQD